MNNNISKLLTVLATATALTGSLAADTTSIQAGLGYRQDSLQWHSKGRANVNPKANSTLHFEDLEIVLLDTKMKTTFGCSDAYFKAAFDYGWIVDGRLRDELTLTRQRRATQFENSGYKDSGEFVDLVIHNDLRRQSYVWDLDFAFGYPIGCWCEEFSIAPALGFSLNRQQINIHGKTLFDDAQASDIHQDIDSKLKHSSKFSTSFWGPYVGVDFAYVSAYCWTAYGQVDVHFGRARRQRTSKTELCHLDRHSKTRNFWGPSLDLGINYIFCENMFADISLHYSKFMSNNHRDDFSWSTGNIRLDLGYMF